MLGDPQGSACSSAWTWAFVLFEWVVASGCCNHDSHNALHWGMHQQFLNQDLMKDVYVAIESPRGTYDKLHLHLGSWLAQTVLLVDKSEPPEALAQVWRALGVDANMADLLANKLGLVCNSGYLHLLASKVEDPKAMEEVSGVWIFLWRLTRFTDIRWRCHWICMKGIALWLDGRGPVLGGFCDFRPQCL